MKIKWYGQACFIITAEDGTTIATDPYTPETAGYVPVSDPAHIAIISSDNDSFHCRADLIPGDPTVVNALALAQNGGKTIEKGIEISAIEAMEALNHKYHDPDQNGMYRFVVDGLSIGHMGDMGNALSPQQIDFFRGVDIFLALAGGHPTIELDDLKHVLDEVQPRLIIPMHFRTLSYKPRNTFWIETFLNYFDQADVDFALGCETTITRQTLPEKTRVLVMDYVHHC
jgi:L-ascorbate metabolism protein UlaG (beta-lactamase superfamily)